MCALASRCKAPVAVASRSRRSVVVSAHKGLEQVQVAAATVVAAALIAGPASAGVILVKPETKKVFQEDSAPAAPVKREFKGLTAPSLPFGGPKSAEAPAVKAEAPKKEAKVESTSSDGLDPRSIALPGALALTVGGFFAAKNLDSSFDEWFNEAMAKDSNNYAGYESTLKAENGVTFPKGGAGTKKVKAASTKKGKK